MQLILMVGIPGSGKTTIRNKIKAFVICPDEFIGYSENDPWTVEKASAAWKKADGWLYGAMKRKEEVILFDATFVSRRSRKKYIKIAGQFGYEVRCIYCKVKFDTAIIRNASRSEFRKVPLKAMERMMSKLQPPTLDEGFVFIEEIEND